MRKALRVVRAESQAEAEQRLLEAVPEGGVSSKDLLRVAELPRDQFAKAIASLIEKGKIKSERRGNKEHYLRA